MTAPDRHGQLRDATRARFACRRSYGTRIRRKTPEEQRSSRFRSRRHTISEVTARRPKSARGPGLAKTRGLPLLRQRSVHVRQSPDYRWRELFERADVMSEGATRTEPEGTRYYGSTSILVPFASRGGPLPDGEVAEILTSISIDPHARLRAVRIARLEAQLRASGPIGLLHAELAVRRDPRGVLFDVEVEARVFEPAQRPEDVPPTAGPGIEKIRPSSPPRKRSSRRR